MKLALPISDDDLRVLIDELDYRNANPKLYPGGATLDELINETVSEGIRQIAKERKT